MSVFGTIHDTFAVEGRKRAWFVDNSREETLSYQFDFRVGGTEQARWKWSGGGPIPIGTIMGNDTVYLDIVADKRIVVAYSMHLRRLSMPTIEPRSRGVAAAGEIVDDELEVELGA